MRLTAKAWSDYADRLSRLNTKAGQLMRAYLERYGAEDTTALISYASALVDKYGEGSAELACQMYDAMAEAAGLTLPAAEPAAPAAYGEVAKAVNGTKHSPALLQNAVSRLVKQAGADTTLKNAMRDGAEFAWIPRGDTCAFCLTLASRGWQRASKKALKNGHAEHIHANCDCEYAVRFHSSTTVAGYDPEQYLAAYEEAEGKTPREKINALRRAHYAENRKKITAQKRAAYKKRSGLTGRTSSGKIVPKELTSLPKYQVAVIPTEKLTQYALNVERSPDKARAFSEALGYTQDNASELIQQIYDNLPNFPAKEKEDRGWGMTYEVVMQLKGPNGKTAKVLTAWIDDNKTGEMRLTTVHVDR